MYDRKGYDKDPKFCLNCRSQISYEQRINKFCSKSCSCSFNNTKRKPRTSESKNKTSRSVKSTIEQKISFKLNQIRNEVKSKRRKLRFILKNVKSTLKRIRKKENNVRIEKKRICKFCFCSFLSRRKSICDNCRILYHRLYVTECRFRFSLKEYSFLFPKEDFDLLSLYGMYKPKNKGDNLKGVSRDHMFSVREGYKLKIEPELMKHPANCKLMLHCENVSKYSRCSITLDELFNKILESEKKYKSKNHSFLMRLINKHGGLRELV